MCDPISCFVLAFTSASSAPLHNAFARTIEIAIMNLLPMDRTECHRRHPSTHRIQLLRAATIRSRRHHRTATTRRPT